MFRAYNICFVHIIYVVCIYFHVHGLVWFGNCYSVFICSRHVEELMTRTHNKYLKAMY